MIDVGFQILNVGVSDIPVFEFSVVTAGADTFQLPLYDGGTYDFIVEWGDYGSSHITAWNDAAANHSYTSAGTHTVKITGIINGWRFNNAGDKTLIHNISSWGPLNLGNSNGYFYGCSNLTVTATDILDLTGTTTLQAGFQGCSSITTIPSMNFWDMAAVTSTYAMFYGASAFNQDIGSWNVGAVTDMYAMFYGASAFNQDIGSWNVGAVTTMQYLFHNASAFDQDICSWNVAAVTNMYYLFHNALAFNQDIGSWNVAAVTTMQSILHGASAFNQDIGSWNVSAVTTMQSMLVDSGISTTNYDLLLVGWEAQAVQNGVVFGAGTIKYSAGAPAVARQALIDDHTWTITDGGQAV